MSAVLADCLIVVDQVRGEFEGSPEGAIRITAWAWGASWRDGLASANTQGSGDVRALTFEYRLDASTGPMMSKCVLGQVIPNVTLLMRRAGGAVQQFLKIALTGVRVMDVDMRFGEGSPLPTVRVAMSFQKADLEYVPRADSGSDRSGSTRFAWRVKGG